MVSPIGFGAFKIGRNQAIKYAQGYELPSDEEAARLLNAVLDLGINLIDTAPAYGISEQRIGAALASRREEFVLSTKVGETFQNGRSRYDFSRQAVMASVAASLSRLRADRIDLLFVHSDGRDVEIQDQTDVIQTLQDLRERGDVRAIGFSGKTVEGSQRAMQWVDCLMIEYHEQDRSHEPLLKEAADRGVGIVVKKGLASGRLSPQTAIPFVLQQPAIASMIVGGLNPDHIRANVRIASSIAPVD